LACVEFKHLNKSYEMFDSQKPARKKGVFFPVYSVRVFAL
jgi:hypothetical protein